MFFNPGQSSGGSSTVPPPKTEEIYSDKLNHIVENPIGGFSKGDSLQGMTLSEILEKLLCIPSTSNEPLVDSLVLWKEIQDIKSRLDRINIEFENN